MNLFGSSDVTVVSDASVLFVQKIVVIIESLYFVAVANMRSGKTPSEILCRLIVVTSFGIEIVDHSAKLCALVGVRRELCIEAVLNVLSPAAGVVRQKSHRGGGVVESMRGLVRNPSIKSVAEEEIRRLFPVEINHVDSLSAEVSGSRIGMRDSRRYKPVVVGVI